jgi:hypothetical protein
VCGGFSNQLFGSDSTYHTTSNYDYDGFLFQVTDFINWIWNFGNPEVIKYGYRTYDVAADMDIDEHGNIYVIATQENQNDVDSSSSTIVGLVYCFDSTGALQQSIKTNRNLQRGAVSTICINNESLTVTGTMLTMTDKPQAATSFIRKFSIDGGKLGEQTVSFSGSSGMLRSAYSNGTKSVYTGHFKNEVTIDSMSITDCLWP